MIICIDECDKVENDFINILFIFMNFKLKKEYLYKIID